MKPPLLPLQILESPTSNPADGRSAFLREVARIADPRGVSGSTPGHRARHLIDGHNPIFTDPFLVLAEDWMPRGTFPLHPHRGIETVSFVLEGSLEHWDSAGNVGLLREGDAQWMTVGRGVQHKEDPPEGETVHMLQLWINLPASEKMTAPRYQDLRRFEMPVRRERGVNVTVFSGRSGTVSAPTLNHVPVTFLDVRLEAATPFAQTLPAFDNAFIYVIDGAIWVGGPETLVQAGQLAWLTRLDDAGPSELNLSADNHPTRFLVLSAPPLREPVAFGGSFVMNTAAEIEMAFADFRDGKF